MIRIRKRTMILYIIIVIIPTLLASFMFIQARNKENLQDRIEDARWFASIHESYWDECIGDTVKTLEMLSMTATTLFADLNKMKPLLDTTQESDPRYGGIYILNKRGNIITGSNDAFTKDGLLHVDFVKEVMLTKDIVISNKKMVSENGQYLIGLAAPVINENDELIAISVIFLRLDYIENIMKVLTPESSLFVLSSDNEPLIKFNIGAHNESLSKGKWITMPIDRLPWKIKVKVAEQDAKGIYFNNLKVIGTILILTHVLFLFIIYLLLKQQAAREKQELETQKLELVGTLAASTAHEIRNPLTGIKGLVQLLSEKYENPADQFYFSVINQEIERINEIASEFLILGKPTAQSLAPVDLTEILQELHPLISTEAVLKQTEFVCEIPSQPILVMCTKDQMKQVILNITRNAFEAMDSGGMISIVLRKKHRHCELTIMDNGTGIEPELLEKVFTPFYTSKATGTGLGLVVCQRILNSFGGRIQITSKENKGTTVTIILPLKRNQ